MTSSVGLRFREQLEVVERRTASEPGEAAEGRPLVVAVSGGLDSCVLLHLLRFALSRPPRVLVAHFDHRMRPGSADDARWLAGVCRAWEVPCVIGVADAPLGSEDEARHARYDFLESTRRTSRASGVLTAHHADDQAETVLFRILRGTGPAGLRGIPAAREPGIYRPLLPFWRRELEAYAAAYGVPWREDPTNAHLSYARNALRHGVLPMAEELVAPGARRALVRLAHLVTEDEEAWEAVMPSLLDEARVAQTAGGGRTFDHQAFLGLDPSLHSRVLRHVAASVGRVPDRALTEQALHFIATTSSGTRFDLRRGVEIRRELDQIVVGPVLPAAGDEPLQIEDAGPGAGDLVVGGRALHVTWESAPSRPAPGAAEDRAAADGAAVTGAAEAGAVEDGAGGMESACFPIGALSFPLTLRSRRPGDRIRLRGGSRKVKKVLLESRIPLGERERIPLVIDGTGDVLWIAGVIRTSHHSPDNDGPVMCIRIQE